MTAQVIYKHLKTDVKAVEERVFARFIPQNTIFPALAYSMITNRDLPPLSGEREEDDGDITLQIDVYSESDLECRTIAEAVVASLYDLDTPPKDIQRQDDFDTEMSLYREIITFGISRYEMILIYSDEEIIALKGKVIKIADFSGNPARAATKVYTNNTTIQTIYENVGIKVLEINVKNIKEI
ncbi:MAG: DUF3168 domain-containing protein [Sulfurovum sp.]